MLIQNDVPVSDLLRQASIKNENQLMGFYDSSWQDCPYTGKITGAYIENGTHVPVKFAQSIAESDFNAA